jgi:hypothetical protein
MSDALWVHVFWVSRESSYVGVVRVDLFADVGLLPVGVNDANALS